MKALKNQQIPNNVVVSEEELKNLISAENKNVDIPNAYMVTKTMKYDEGQVNKQSSQQTN